MSRAEKRALNQHLHRRHGQASLAGSPDMSLRNRLEAHERMHAEGACDHTHEDYEYPAMVTDLVKDA